jgi:4-amino-4-deoxy-L-arabinose transferase-like glycosyltransferase
MIDAKTYRQLYVLIGLTYLSGLFITPLMENDAVEYATIALKMFQEGDYANIINRFNDYLDKPHLLFWLSALSFKIFGISDWAYRLPSVLITFLGAYATYRLGRLLYHKDIGKLSALIFLTSQATILGNHDVRTDALLTGLVITGIWQLAEFIRNDKTKHIFFGGAAVALGFSTKGQIAVLTAAIAVLCHILYLRKWNSFWNWKWLIGLAAFLIVSSPMLYCYYHQFDMHPEKLVRGHYHVSGIKFIFWEQSFERLIGGRSFTNNPEYFFLHHNFLWAFLPWSAVAVVAIFSRATHFIVEKFKKSDGMEFLTWGGPVIVFSIISFSSFKLPHYMNVLFPLFSILTASYLFYLQENNKKHILKIFLVILYIMGGVFLCLLVLLNLWSFPIDNWYWGTFYILFLLYVVYVFIKPFEMISKIIIASVVLITFTNVVLHTNFYPKLIKYQSGSELAHIVKAEKIPLEDIYYFRKFSRSFDFYNEYFIPEIRLSDLKSKNKGSKIWVFTYQKGLKKLKAANIKWAREIKVEHFRITMLTWQFLNPDTRPQSLTQSYLLEII